MLCHTQHTHFIEPFNSFFNILQISFIICTSLILNDLFVHAPNSNSTHELRLASGMFATGKKWSRSKNVSSRNSSYFKILSSCTLEIHSHACPICSENNKIFSSLLIPFDKSVSRSGFSKQSTFQLQQISTDYFVKS